MNKLKDIIQIITQYISIYCVTNECFQWEMRRVSFLTRSSNIFHNLIFWNLELIIIFCYDAAGVVNKICDTKKQFLDPITNHEKCIEHFQHYKRYNVGGISTPTPEHADGPSHRISVGTLFSDN